MDKIKKWLDNKMFWLKTGAHIEIVNDGKPVEEIVIRYKQYFFGVMLDVESGEPTGNFGWSEDPGVFHVPIREHYVAQRTPKANGDLVKGAK